MNKDGDRSEASEHLRGLVSKIVLTPRGDNDGLTIDLYGYLAGILNMTKEKKDMSKSPMLKRLQLLQVNDNSPVEAFQDSVGCGGRI